MPMSLAGLRPDCEITRSIPRGRFCFISWLSDSLSSPGDILRQTAAPQTFTGQGLRQTVRWDQGKPVLFLEKLIQAGVLCYHWEMPQMGHSECARRHAGGLSMHFSCGISIPSLWGAYYPHLAHEKNSGLWKHYVAVEHRAGEAPEQPHPWLRASPFTSSCILSMMDTINDHQSPWGLSEGPAHSVDSTVDIME